MDVHVLLYDWMWEWFTKYDFEYSYDIFCLVRDFLTSFKIGKLCGIK